MCPFFHESDGTRARFTEMLFRFDASFCEYGIGAGYYFSGRNGRGVEKIMVVI